MPTEFATTEPVTAALVSSPSASQTTMEAATEPTPVIAPDLGRLMELSGNIHLFSAVPQPALADEPIPNDVVANDTVIAARPPNKHKGLLVIAAVMIGGVAGNVVLWNRSNDRQPRPASPAASSVPSLVQQTPQPTREPAALPVLPPPQIAPLPDRCRVEITVQDAEARLALDGNLAGGNQIKLDVPKEDKVHIVEASAPGFIPFTRSVNFSQDVYLTISLEKERPPGHPISKDRPARAATRAVATSRVKPDAKRADDIGIASRPTGTKRATSKIDEDDPYAP